MPQTDVDVLVVGAGVIGLTTAICLAEAGLAVTVAAAEPPEQTTSAAAGALWGPHLVGADDRIARWAGVTLDRLAELSSPQLGANALAGTVRTVRGIAATADANQEPPRYAAAGSTTPCRPDELPAGYTTGWHLAAPLIEMPRYLSYLKDRLGRAGGTSTFSTRFGTLADARAFAPQARAIVNCTGYGARDLLPDPTVEAVRGQVVVVRNPGIDEFFVGTGAAGWPLTHFFPHDDVVVLGGTHEAGNTSREPDLATSERIIAACAAVRPELRDAAVLAHRVGLRPVRPAVRLDAQQLDAQQLDAQQLDAQQSGAGRDGDITVVHSYGHGGAGVTLSWGCAEDAAKLVLAALG